LLSVPSTPAPPSLYTLSLHDALPILVVKGAGNVLAKLARCCTPVPPDEIEGFVTRGQGVTVYRADCRNVQQLRQEPGRLVEVERSEEHTSELQSRFDLVCRLLLEKKK